MASLRIYPSVQRRPAVALCFQVCERSKWRGHESNGNRAFVTCSGASGLLAATHLTDLRESIRTGPKRVHVHFGGIYIYGPLRLQLRTLIRELRARATASSVTLTVSLDPNATEAAHVEGLESILELVDLFKGNAVEAKLLARSDSTEEALVMISNKVHTAAVMTCGRDGVHYRLGVAGETLQDKGPTEANVKPGFVPACPVDVLDSTGAGDAFGAGLLAAWVLDVGFENSLHFASAVGAANCKHIGGSSIALTSRDAKQVLDDCSRPLVCDLLTGCPQI